MPLKKILVFSFLLITLYLQYGRTPTVNHAITSKNTTRTETTLTITANKLFVFSKKQLSRSLVQRMQRNDFPNMQLSSEITTPPSQITIIVYVNRLAYMLDLPAFEFVIKY